MSCLLTVPSCCLALEPKSGQIHIQRIHFIRNENCVVRSLDSVIKNVFVDRAPLHMPNKYISSSLSAYGRVVDVRNLCVHGFQDTRNETRMVTMSILKPIPVVVKIANFPCSVRNAGQPPILPYLQYFWAFCPSLPAG